MFPTVFASQPVVVDISNFSSYSVATSFYYPEESCPKGRSVLISISWNGWFETGPYEAFGF